VSKEAAPVDIPWYYDSMVWVGFLSAPVMWFAMAIFLSIEIAWISLACGGLIGFFLWLVALGYENPRMAKATLVGISINIILAIYSAQIAFG
tara:strand:- start:189 stop:464 length:276 start_codon:yes stop_codon:yes gene_type:complete